MLGDSGGAAKRAAALYQIVADNDLWTATERVGALPSMDTFIERLTLERVLLVQFALSDGQRTDNATLRLVTDRNAAVVEQPSTGVRRFHDLLRAGHPAVILTVNFDCLVESATDICFEKLATPDELSRCHAVISAYLRSGGVPGSPERPIPYIKLHGTIEDLTSIVADVESVASGFERAVEEGLELLISDTDPIPWVYVGHSMRDLDLQQIVAAKRFALGTKETWVDPILADSVERFAAKNRDSFWERAGRPNFVLRRVTATADRFFAELHSSCVEDN